MTTVDTNVLSKQLRLTPEPRAQCWLAAPYGLDIYPTAFSEAELRNGVATMGDGRRAAVVRARGAAVATRDTDGFDCGGVDLAQPLNCSAKSPRDSCEDYSVGS
jgi:predicted nucleic acid-binding protein